MGIKKEIFQFLKKNQKALIYLLFLIIAAFLFKPSFSSYFFQDDWFTFKISSVKSMKDFFLFFVPRIDVIYYRPLGMQVYFFLMRLLFGLNPFFYRLSALLLHSFNALLVVCLFQRLKLEKWWSLTAGFLYLTSVTPYIPFFWSATFPFILGVSFFLLSFYFYITRKKDSKQPLTSLFFFILALLTIETTVFLPVILFFWERLIHKTKSIKEIMARIVGYLVVVFFYVVLRLLIFPVSFAGTYGFKISPLATIRSYFMWIFNWPEEIARQIVSVYKINPLFWFDFKFQIILWLITTIILFSVLILIPSFLTLRHFFLKRKKVLYAKELLFGLCWFVLFLIPLFLFSDHVFPYYLSIPLIGLLLAVFGQINSLVVSYRLTLKFKLIFTLLVIISWFAASFQTVRFNVEGHWAKARANLAFDLVKQVEPLIDPDKVNVITFRKGDHSDWDLESYKYALNDQEAFQILFGDQTVTVYGELTEKDNFNDEQFNIIKL